jgi:crotonobetainyl-CoA:carnitine CoA-transferase CaiB-like acyl-CoA transferase
MTISKDDYKGISSPIKLSRSQSVGVKHKPPFIGQHTKEILMEAGYSEDAINELLSEEIVFQN